MVYIIIVCGIRNLRVIMGPLPLFICHLQVMVAKVLAWIGSFIVFAITFSKFMFICVWKSLRQMNDDLIATACLIQALFFGDVHILCFFLLRL